MRKEQLASALKPKSKPKLNCKLAPKKISYI